MAGSQKNEGEGNKTAAREYNKATEAFAKDHDKVDRKAREAAEARKGPERAELDEAEKEGRSHAKEFDPQVTPSKKP